MRPRLAALTLLALLSACKVDGSTRTPTPDGPATDGRGDDGTAAATATPVRFAQTGVPHASTIARLAIDPTGQAALSSDNGGSVRLWPALDGSREPLVVPIRDPRQLALAGDGNGSWTLALLDAAGGARVVAVAADGAMQPLASLSPTDSLFELIVLPGGERLLAVGKDHVIRLLDRHGTELDRIDEPSLRPATLRQVIDGEGNSQVVAVTAGEFDGKQSRFVVDILPLVLDGDQLALAPTRTSISLDSPPTSDNPSLSPDGRAIVYLQRQRIGSTTWLVAAKQLADGKQVSHDSQLMPGLQPRLVPMPRGRVLLDDGTGIGRVVDLQQRRVELLALRSSPQLNHQAAVFAGHVRVAPSGTWLAIHELERDELSYLGYEPIVVNSAGLSPAAEAVAWSLSDRVAVEPLVGDARGEVIEVPGTRNHAQVFVGFVDAEHLIMLDWNGAAQLLRWRDGQLRSEIDVRANVVSAELRRADGGDGLLLVRTSLWQNPALIELTDSQIGARHLIHGATHLAGLLTPADHALDDWGLWVFDASARLHQFPLASLRDGLDIATALSHGETLASPLPEHFTITPDGTRYGVRTVGARPQLFVEDQHGRADSLQLEPGFVVSLSASPDGRRLAIVQQRDPGQLLTSIDTATLQPAWTKLLPTSMAISWSDAGEALAIPATLGGVVLDAGDGTVRTSRCGLAFERRRTAPLAFHNEQPISVCEP